MGRSVETPLHAETVFFHHWEIEPEDWDISGELFDEDIADPARDALRAAFPSFEPTDARFHPNSYTRYDETRVILENGHALVTISEYCGLVAIALVPRTETHYAGDEEHIALHEYWAAQVADRFTAVLAETFGGRLAHLGTMSNGEAVFKHVAA